MRLWEIVDGRPARFHTIGPRRTTIGRGACDVRVEDLRVSREHCSIKLREGVPVLTDLASVNGTFLNGHPVQEHALADGDEIRIGSTVLRFHLG
jgi:pSer/pThr/pTyr-binding forkhead associated (FHA) protein